MSKSTHKDARIPIRAVLLFPENKLSKSKIVALYTRSAKAILQII